MKKTGRTLTLSNGITLAQVQAGINSISDKGYALTTIFQDDREGYGWKVTKFERFGLFNIAVNDGFALFSKKPDDFDPNVGFSDWVLGFSVFSNEMIGTIVDDLTRQVSYSSLKEDHVAVSHLAILHDETQLPLYNITLEEYEISDREEIAFMIKESSQNIGLTE